MYEYKDVTELLEIYSSLEWDVSSVTSSEFMPIFKVTGLNMKTVFITTSVSGHTIFVTLDFNSKYYIIDYIISERLACVTSSDAVKLLYYKIKGDLKL